MAFVPRTVNAQRKFYILCKRKLEKCGSRVPRYSAAVHRELCNANSDLINWKLAHPALGKVHTNFGFSTSICFWVSSRHGTDRQMDKTRIAASPYKKYPDQKHFSNSNTVYHLCSYNLMTLKYKHNCYFYHYYYSPTNTTTIIIIPHCFDSGQSEFRSYLAHKKYCYDNTQDTCTLSFPKTGLTWSGLRKVGWLYKKRKYGKYHLYYYCVQLRCTVSAFMAKFPAWNPMSTWALSNTQTSAVLRCVFK